MWQQIETPIIPPHVEVAIKVLKIDPRDKGKYKNHMLRRTAEKIVEQYLKSFVEEQKNEPS